MRWRNDAQQFKLADAQAGGIYVIFHMIERQAIAGVTLAVREENLLHRRRERIHCERDIIPAIGYG